MGISEREIIEIISRTFASTHPELQLGIGDDAAVFTGSPHQVVTTDVAVEGTHFKQKWSSPIDIGRRVIAANIADLLSMNAQPQFLLVTLTLTGDEDREWIENVARGIAEEAARTGAVVIGGDTARGKELSIGVTAIGKTSKVVTRSGAQVGEQVYLSSLTGWSAAGLTLMQSDSGLRTPAAEKARSQYRAPSLDYGIDFSSASAMCDVSDSLAVQGAQLAQASGVRLVINEALLENSSEYAELKVIGDEIGVDVFTWIAAGGEDHVLLATGDNLPGLCIGEVREGIGLDFIDREGNKKVAPQSWDHFH